MIKKIAADKLRVGMYVHDLNTSWLDHAFLSNQFAIKKQSVIDKIHAAKISHLYIDTQRGLDVKGPPSALPVENSVTPDVLDYEEDSDQVEAISFEAELQQARLVARESSQAVRDLMREARFGRPVEEGVVNELVDNISQSVFRNQDALISLCRIKHIDEYTYMHSLSVCVLMTSFARAMDYSVTEVRQIAIGALLHDMGKMRVPPQILNKPASLTDEEFGVMKSHVDYSAELIAGLEWMVPNSVDVVMQHHERIDGSGYPYGLKGDEISKIGQMSAIVDVYDALTSERCYKGAWEPTVTLGKMLEWSPEHFDAAMVHQFVRCMGIYPVATLVLLDKSWVAIVVKQNPDKLLLPRVRIVYDANMGSYITPRDIDLSQENYKIVEALPPQQFHIDPQRFL